MKAINPRKAANIHIYWQDRSVARNLKLIPNAATGNTSAHHQSVYGKDFLIK